MIYVFGNFELDIGSRELRQHGKPARVEARPLELLTYLVENRDRVVTKQELIEVVWRGAVVSRSTLPIAVYGARRAIRQDRGHAGPIATVGRQGYRFTANIEVGDGAAGPTIGQVSPFVGRTDVMSALTCLLTEARAGQGKIGLLTGEAGIGKSRTARELALVAREFGIPVWTGQSTEGGGAPPFWTWKPIITATLEMLSERQLASLLKGGLPPEFDRLFPELTAHAPRVPRLPAASGPTALHRVNETLSRLALGVPSTRARLVILEDLQWADNASLELLLHISTRISDARLLIIGTLRDDDAAPGDTRYEQLHRLFRASACHRIGLPQLTAAEVAEVVARLTRGPDSSALAAAIYKKTQGNPFFIEETVRWLQSEAANAPGASPRRIDPSVLPVPDAVREVIRRRLRTVSQSTRDLLAFAAVIGTEFNLSLLQHSARGEAAEQLSQLKEATESKLLSWAKERGTALRFTHVIIRETIYQDLPAERRAALHLRVGEALQEQTGPDADRLLDGLAFHFYRSLPAAPGRAFEYCLRAARVAHSVSVSEQACTLYERALEAWAFQPESQRDHVQRCVALLGIAHCSLSIPRGINAPPLVADAIRLARVIHRPDLLALGVVLANAYAAAGHRDVEAIPDVTAEALDLLPDGVPAAQAYLLSWVASKTGIPAEQRRALAGKAIDLVTARQRPTSGDDLLGPDLKLLRSEAVRLSLGGLGPDDLELCVKLATGVIRNVEPDDALCVRIALRIRAKAHLTLGDLAASREDIRRSCQLPELRDAVLVDLENISVEGFWAQMEGRFDDAQREVDRLADPEWPIAPSHRDFLRRLRTFVLEEERGVPHQVDVEQEFLERVPADLIRTYRYPRSSANAIACRLFLMGNHRELALNTFERVAERGFGTIPRDGFYLSTLCDLALACREFSDVRRAAELYELLRPYASLFAVEIPLHNRGPVAHFLGLLAHTLGRPAVAIEHFEAAATISACVGTVPMLNRTRVELATALRDRKDSGSRQRAAALVEEGIASARKLGMIRVCAALEGMR